MLPLLLALRPSQWKPQLHHSPKPPLQNKHTLTHIIKHPNQFVLKTCFSQPYWVVLEIYDAPSAAKKEKSLAPSKPICPARRCGGPVTIAAIKRGGKKKIGGWGWPHPYISAAQWSTDRLPHCTPRPAPSSRGINQDNSLHALNSDPATIHTYIRRGGGERGATGRWSSGGRWVKMWERGDGSPSQGDSGWGNREDVCVCVRVCMFVCVWASKCVRLLRLVTAVQIEAAVPSKRSVFMSH